MKQPVFMGFCAQKISGPHVWQREAELNSKLFLSGAAKAIFCICTTAHGPPAPSNDMVSLPPNGGGAAIAGLGIYRKITMEWQENSALLWDCFIAKI